MARPITTADNFTAAMLQDALNTGTAATYRRRAAEFEAARPRLGEFYGQRTVDDLRRHWLDLTEIAAALRARADVLDDEISPDVLNVLGEAS